MHFFAGIAVVFAHLLYESNAPEIIRKFSEDELKLIEKEQYSAQPTTLRKKNALDILKTDAGTIIYNKKNNWERNMVNSLEQKSKSILKDLKLLTHGQFVLIYMLFENNIDYWMNKCPKVYAQLNKAYGERGQDVMQESILRNDLTIIEAAAEARYQMANEEHSTIIPLVGFLYIVGAILIIIVMVIQGTNILEKANIL